MTTKRLTDEEVRVQLHKIRFIDHMVMSLPWESFTPTQLRALHDTFETAMWQCKGYLGEAEAQQEGRLVKVDEAARLLDVSEDYLYRHADELPFTRRMPSRGKRMNLRFSRTGIADYLRQGGNGSR